VVVVDDLDERLDLAALLLAGLGHATGDLRRVPLDSGYDGVGVWVRLVAGVLRLDDDDLCGRIESAFLFIFLVAISTIRPSFPFFFPCTRPWRSREHLRRGHHRPGCPLSSNIPFFVQCSVCEGGEIYLPSGISAPGDDGNTADLEDCKTHES
jgi:hypothetical protein